MLKIFFHFLKQEITRFVWNVSSHISVYNLLLKASGSVKLMRNF